jgi:hypothetical protein
MKKLLVIFTLILFSSEIFSQSCLPNGIDFNTQAQVDNFQANNPGCTQIEGGVEINGDDISNLDGLSVITSIGSYLYITNNDILDNLSGLSSLMHLGGALLISTNASLTDLSGLEGLSVVEGDVFISNNPVLATISALANINAANVLELRLTGNVSLATCDNTFICNYLANPTGKVNIYNNAPGCNNPPEIAESCGIILPCLPFGSYYFATQAEIDDFQLHYPGCTDLKGGVKVTGGDITNLAGLSSVNSVAGAFEIHNNPQLTSLAGLDSLSQITGTLTIVGNSLLTDISAISLLDTSTVTFLGITNNPVLAVCENPFVCDYLFGTFGAAHNNISGNADGCKSRDEVLLACTVGFDEIKDEEVHLKISPNPASTKITIEIPGEASKFLISIFNLNGKELITMTVSDPVTVIDIQHLPAGIYFVRLTGEKTAEVEKFVKMD